MNPLERTITRRGFLRLAGTAGVGAAALALVGCEGGPKNPEELLQALLKTEFEEGGFTSYEIRRTPLDTKDEKLDAVGGVLILVVEPSKFRGGAWISYSVYKNSDRANQSFNIQIQNPPIKNSVRREYLDGISTILGRGILTEYAIAAVDNVLVISETAVSAEMTYNLQKAAFKHLKKIK